MATIQELEAKLPEIQQQIVSEVAALSKRTTTVTYGHLFLFVLVLGLMGWMYLMHMRSYDKAMARSDAQFEIFMKSEKEYRADLKESEQQRVELAQRQTVIYRNIEARDKEADKKVIEVTSPDRSDDQVSNDSLAYLGYRPVVIPGNPFAQFAYPKAAVQGFIANKVNLDRCQGDLNNTKALLNTEQLISKSLSDNLGQCNATLIQGQTALTSARTVAKKTWKQKVLGVVGDTFKDAGKILLGIGIGKIIQ